MTKDFVILTGAYGGLGKALAYQYAKNGYGLILLGRKEASLKTLQKDLSKHTTIYPIVCDVSNWESCQNAQKLIDELQVSVKVLINNAGITYIQNFNQDYEIEQYKKLIETNLNGAVYLSRLFMNDLIENKGSIINISSVIGFAPVLGRTAYAASKFGLEGFFSVLQAEMNDQLHIMMVYPTFIATHIRDGLGVETNKYKVLTAENVASSVLKAHQQKKKKVYIGRTAKISYYLYKFFPKLYVNLMKKNVES